MKAKPKKRLVKGRDWHGWVWKNAYTEGGWKDGEMLNYAHPTKPDFHPTPEGKWVRVKFVEVK